MRACAMIPYGKNTGILVLQGVDETRGKSHRPYNPWKQKRERLTCNSDAKTLSSRSTNALVDPQAEFFFLTPA